MLFTLKRYMEFSGITDESEARERIKSFIEMLGCKQIDKDTFDIPNQFVDTVRSIMPDINRNMEWKCNCGTVNNVKNGEKCLKCDLTYKDWLFRQQEDYAKNLSIKYQPITDRETSCFLFGKYISMLQSRMPKHVDLKSKIKSANIAGSMTHDFTTAMEKQYNKLREGEIFDVIHQLGNPNIEIAYEKIFKTLEIDIKSKFNE